MYIILVLIVFFLKFLVTNEVNKHLSNGWGFDFGFMVTEHFELIALLHSMISIIMSSDCDTVHCGSKGRCSGLKVVPACS